MIFKTKDNVEYEIDEYGVIHQLNPSPFEYNNEYISTYDKPEYVAASNFLTGVRAGIVCSRSRMFKEVFDVGYGKGDFLKAMNQMGFKCYGKDVTGSAPPNGVCEEENYEALVTTYWDVFEHIPQLLKEVRKWKSKHVIMSMPDVSMCKDFDNWKHRKPDEHLHHFSPSSIKSSIESVSSYKMVWYGHPENVIREDIMTVIFER